MAEHDRILIGPPTLEERGEFVRTSFPVEGFATPELWFDVDARYAEALDNSCDAALVSLLMAAMDQGKPIELQGPVSGKLLWGLRNIVVPAMCASREFLSPVPLETHGIIRDAKPSGNMVLTPLSCGIDSFSAVQDHAIAPDLDPGDRVTHLVFGHIGHNGYGEDTDARAHARWQVVRSAAGELGLPILRFNSNQHHFYSPQYNYRLNWLSTMTVRSAAIPLLLQAGVRRFFLASGHTWREIGVGSFRDISRLDPILLPALSTERVELVAVGTERTRVEKSRRIGDLGVVHRHLDVCIMEGGKGCSRCEKCMRTMLTFELLGRLDKFADRFDLEEYRRNRKDFVARVWLDYEDDHCHLEIKELMDEIGFKPSLPERARAWMIRLWRWIPHPFAVG